MDELERRIATVELAFLEVPPGPIARRSAPVGEPHGPAAMFDAGHGLRTAEEPTRSGAAEAAGFDHDAFREWLGARPPSEAQGLERAFEGRLAALGVKGRVRVNGSLGAAALVNTVRLSYANFDGHGPLIALAMDGDPDHTFGHEAFHA